MLILIASNNFFFFFYAKAWFLNFNYFVSRPYSLGWVCVLMLMDGKWANKKKNHYFILFSLLKNIKKSPKKKKKTN